jgi:Ribosomal protein L13
LPEYCRWGESAKLFVLAQCGSSDGTTREISTGQGKDKPTFAPHLDDGDVVVVINAKDVEFTGNKWEKKLYRWHTGYFTNCPLPENLEYQNTTQRIK